MSRALSRLIFYHFPLFLFTLSPATSALKARKAWSAIVLGATSLQNKWAPRIL